jgi:hypothetical protein
MKVMASRLGNAPVSITLINKDGCWRFDHWTTVEEAPVPVHLAPRDLLQEFTTSEDALRYFDRRYRALVAKA